MVPAPTAIDIVLRQVRIQGFAAYRIHHVVRAYSLATRSVMMAMIAVVATSLGRRFANLPVAAIHVIGVL